MIITLDGPAASGKSSIARGVATKLGIMHINSGLLYRGLAYYLVTQAHESIEHFAQLDEAILRYGMSLIAYQDDPSVGAGRIILDGHDITNKLKTPEMDTAASVLSTNPLVRVLVNDTVRSYGKNASLICDGRDCGSVVFPNAEYHFYVTADSEIRAERWRQDQAKAGKIYTHHEALQIIEERDSRDSKRTASPLKKHDKAEIILTNRKTIKDIVDYICQSVTKNS